MREWISQLNSCSGRLLIVKRAVVCGPGHDVKLPNFNNKLYLNMKLITRNTDYALRAICYIAKSKKKVVSVNELVASLKMPRPFLRKILQRLNREGILRSLKGANGGFALHTTAEKIFLTDLIGIFQGALKLNECFFKRKICPNKSKCNLKKIISGIEADVFNKLKKVNIRSLLD